MFNENVKNLLEKAIWDFSTVSADGEPNVVPIFFKSVAEDGTMAMADVFMKKTVQNVQENEKVTVSVFDAQTLEGYQIKGTAKYVTEGAEVAAFKPQVEKLFNGAATARGAVIMKPEKVIVMTPGGENNKVL